MKNLKFSIAVMTFNVEEKVSVLLKSLREQNYKNYEIVVVDGGSSDHTEKIVRGFLTDNDKWMSEPDNGVYDAMNKALRLATGDFLIFMGADDWFYNNDVLSNVAKKIIKYGKLDCIYYGGVFMERYQRIINKEWNRFDWVRGTMCHQCIFYPISTYKNYDYDLRYKINADYAYNLYLWDKVKFVHIDIVVSFFSASGLSGGGKEDEQFRKDLPNLIKVHCGYFPYLYKKMRMLGGAIFK